MKEKGDEQNNMENRNNNSGSGFLFGVLVGVAITLLFTTKKGRKILKAITDEGLDKISNLEDLFEKRMQEEDEDDMGLDYDAKASMNMMTHQQPMHMHHHEVVQSVPMPQPTPQSNYSSSEQMPTQFHHTASHGRRFFRGIPKRSN